MKTQRAPKLEQIEKKLYRLWTNRADRSHFLDNEIVSARQASQPDDFVRQIDPRGVKLYSTLIEIGRMDLMSSIYPIVEKLVGKQFKNLVLEYFESMPPVHFNLNQSASRFPQFLAGQDKLIARYPFLLELADYEWIELAVLEDPAADIAYEAPAQNAPVDAARFAGLSPVLNGVLVSRRYRYAIANLAEEISEGKKLPRRVKESPAFVIVYRDPDSLDARFLDLDELSFSMLEAIGEKPGITYGELITAICSRPQCADENALTHCLEAIEQLRELKLIVAEKTYSKTLQPQKVAGKAAGSETTAAKAAASKTAGTRASALKVAKKSGSAK